MIIRPHDPNGENPAARPLQLRRSDILQPGTSVPGTLPHRDHAPIGRNLTVTKREKATLASHLAFRRRERAALWRAGALLPKSRTKRGDLQKEKADHVSMIGPYLCRQRPTLPHTFACSTIGPAGLNCRVRDGNGWIPRGKITDNLRRLASVNEPPTRRRLGACCRNPEPCLCSSRRRIQNAKLDACPFGCSRRA